MKEFFTFRRILILAAILSLHPIYWGAQMMVAHSQKVREQEAQRLADEKMAIELPEKQDQDKLSHGFVTNPLLIKSIDIKFSSDMEKEDISEAILTEVRTKIEGALLKAGAQFGEQGVPIKGLLTWFGDDEGINTLKLSLWSTGSEKKFSMTKAIYDSDVDNSKIMRTYSYELSQVVVLEFVDQNNVQSP